jgi:hypothetical protein
MQAVVVALQPNDVGDGLAGNAVKVCTGSVHLSTIGFGGA